MGECSSAHSPSRAVPSAAERRPVNTLVLINNSKRPLLLLAGEIVTGGKQDRVIGKDRIVPGESDPIDLGVFCVEPGRWVARSDKFGTTIGLAQPSVRAKAMVDKDQQKVWDQLSGSTRRTGCGSASALGRPGNGERKRQTHDFVCCDCRECRS